MVASLIGALALLVVVLIVAVYMNNQPAPGKGPVSSPSASKATPETGPKVEAPLEKKIEGEKLDAKCLKDSVVITVKSVRVGYAKFDKSKTTAINVATRYLVLTLEIENTNQARKLDYESWNVAASAIGQPAMIDNQKPHNKYRFRQFPPGTVEGQLEKEPLMAGTGKKPLLDVLLFEEPVKAPDTIINIELPTQAFGEPGTVDLNIPITRIAIDKVDEELEKQAKAAAAAAAHEAATKAPAGKKPDKASPKSPEKAAPKKVKRPPPPADDDEPPVVRKPRKQANPDDPLPLDLDNAKGLPVGKGFGPEDH
jgi:hypothetical protein